MPFFSRERSEILRRRSAPARAGIATIALLAAVSLAAADEGRIPLFRITRITEPGSYLLTRDVSASAAEVIRVDVDGVVVDLNGHTITLQGSSGTGIAVGPSVREVTLRNGRIQGGSSGIAWVAGPGRGRIRIERVDVIGPATYGIYVAGADSVEIRGSRVAGAGLDGIHVDGVAGSFRGRFVDNAIEGAARDGLVLRGLAAGEVRGNSVIGQARGGIVLSGEIDWNAGGSVVEANTVRGGAPASIGIDVAAGAPNNVIVKNVTTRNALQGISVASSGNRIAENDSSGNGADGIRVDGGYNLVERNVLTANAFGLRMACNFSRYRDNMMLGNTTLYCTGPCCGTGNVGGNLF